MEDEDDHDSLFPDQLFPSLPLRSPLLALPLESAALPLSDRKIRSVWQDGSFQVQPVRHSEEIYSIQAMNDGRHLISSCCAGLHNIWDVSRGRLVRTLTAGPEEICLRCAPALHGSMLWVGAACGKLFGWDVWAAPPLLSLRAGNTQQTLRASLPGLGVRQVSVAADGDALLTNNGLNTLALRLAGEVRRS
eukprot:PLAT1290.3.p1 GENE.PLAT1290.3~~PLAT1290.3.p1  ORF type:complete len:211 (+),score=37.89 PLAT1290.3:63-635(+)